MSTPPRRAQPKIPTNVIRAVDAHYPQREPKKSDQKKRARRPRIEFLTDIVVACAQRTVSSHVHHRHVGDNVRSWYRSAMAFASPNVRTRTSSKLYAAHDT